MSTDLVNTIFGMKVRQARTEAGLTLTELAKQAGLSASYLTEIEKGRKYPRNDKILRMAQALGKGYDDLVSIKLRPSLSYLETTLASPLLGRFPFAEFGIETQDLVNLLTREPEKASALLHAILDIARQYDLQEEEFLRAALRSYQEIHENYFPELEQAALDFTAEFGQPYTFAADGPVALATLQTILQERYGYRLDDTTMAARPELAGYRSVLVAGERPLLLINPGLYPRQVKFLLARELGYQFLGLAERSTTSTPNEVHSFTQLLNDYKAAYFGGALLMPRAALLADLRRFFALPTWQPQALADLLTRYDVTPEMLFYRFSELIPQHFGIKTHFLRFHHVGDQLRLIRHLNFNQLMVPSGIGLQEHYCRRWLSARLLRDMRAAQAAGDAWERFPLPGIHVSRFVNGTDQFVALGFVRSLVLSPGVNSSVTLGFRLTPDLPQTVRFLNDPAIPHEIINETCERCPLTAAECSVRAAPPTVLQAQQRRQAREAALAALNGSS
ncbi:MAG: ImmA/IrrE family metallo-endopeptidase [Anaerolineales bacterium]|nr:ImmA/IrrE family metallo-endopeptidase [Anaerolineales bacterium]